MKKGILIQARMSSKRLPGKSLRDICGRPLIYYVIDRVKRVTGIDEVVLVTSSDSSDDALADFALELDTAVFRGNLENVQKRFFDAAKQYALDVIIRVTGDNPLISPELIHTMISQWEKTNVDYIGYDKSCILGTGAELFTFSSFEKVVALSKTPYDYEHVTPPYYQKTDFFKCLFLKPPATYVNDSLRLTVDTEEDLAFIKSIYERYNVNGYVVVDTITQRGV
ncbi:MAG: glycosyltransferase family protein [Candidatus Omnitrophica bacterium]|nr:glycosyltransferase family protein [Candidatus Omnitrophota bacterium]